MKKYYLLFLSLALSLFAYSQKSGKLRLDQEASNDLRYDYQAKAPSLHYQENSNHKKAIRFNNKAILDTLAYEDFDTSFATASTHGKFKWKSAQSSGDIFIGGVSMPKAGGANLPTTLKSTTGSNGIIGFPAAYYNPPFNGLKEFSTFITSGPIPLGKGAKSIYLQVQQLFARCCYFAPTMFLEVSTDSINWTNVEGIEENTLLSTFNTDTNNIRPMTFNISQVAANRDSIYVRFSVDRLSAWIWMIDDVVILEGPRHDLTVSKPRMLFNAESFYISPRYTRIPFNLLSPAYVGANISNGGWDIARNTSLITELIWKSDTNGVVFTDTLIKKSQSVGNLKAFPFDTNVVETESFNIDTLGIFQLYYGAETDSADQISNLAQVAAGDADSIYLAVNDTVFAKDGGVFDPSIGISPVSFARGPSVGGFNNDAFGTLYNLERKDTLKIFPTSISYYVSNNPANIGIVIEPSVWVLYEDTALVTDAWHPLDTLNRTGIGLVLSGDDYKLTASDTNSWLTLKLNHSTFSGLDSGQYLVGWRVVSGSTVARDKYFEVVNDLSAAEQQMVFSSMMFHGNTIPKEVIWHSPNTPFQPVIRLNLGRNLPLAVAIEDVNHSKNLMFEVVPNPSQGELKINLRVEEQATYQLRVRNILGQVVYEDGLSVNGQITERLNLAHLEKGLYFVSVENAFERLLKKVILQ